MPRNNGYKRKAAPKRKANSKSMKDVALNVVLDNIETKKKQISLITNVSSTIQNVSFLDRVFGTQGTTSTEFIGANVRLQSLSLRALFTQADTTNLMRVLLVRMRGCPVDKNDLFVDKTVPLLSDLNSTYIKKVYMDRMIFLRPTASGVSDYQYVIKNVNFANRRLYFDGVGDTMEDYQLVMVSDSAIGPNPNAVLYWTVRWKDA